MNELKRQPTKSIAEIIAKIGESNPQKVFCAIYSAISPKIVNEKIFCGKFQRFFNII